MVVTFARPVPGDLIRQGVGRTLLQVMEPTGEGENHLLVLMVEPRGVAHAVKVGC